MAESLSNPPGTGSATEVGQDDALVEDSFKARLKQKKLLLVLSTAALGGLLLGVSGMTLIAYLQPAAKEAHAPPAVVTPEPDPKQEAQAKELEELKAKNEKLEEQLRLSQSGVQESASAHDAVSPVAAPSPVIPPTRSAGAKPKEKVTADCTVPDKTEKLSDTLKSCIEGFNASTH